MVIKPDISVKIQIDYGNITSEEEKLNNISRREFMKLSLEERRLILAQQAEAMLPYYQQNREWQELETGDLIDYYKAGVMLKSLGKHFS